MNSSQAIKLLKNNSVFWSKLGFYHDPVRFDKNGKPIVFFDNFERFANDHQSFSRAGIKIHTSILFNGWVGINKYDYSLTDRVLNSVFENNEDIWYIPRIKLNVPLDWGKENPEDICVYYNGPREVEAIRALVGTEKHDILGYNSPIGYYTAGGWKDDRPNVGGVISNQSFSSEKWLKDAGETLTRLIEHLENGPYGKRILAYHIAYGVSGETCLWGRFSNPKKFADYGINNRKAFYDWGLKKYKSLDILRRTWNNSQLTRKNCEPPPPELRENNKVTVKDFLRQDKRYQICIDYDKFMGEVNVNALECFAKIVKDKTVDKAVGGFYGYFMEVSRSAYTGHLEMNKLLNSKNIDFIAAPKSYYRCEPGEPGGELTPAQSVNRKNLWLDELDNRTHLCTTSEKVCKDFQETKSVMWREFAKNMMHGSGMWWMDLGGGWFDSPEIMNEIKKIEVVKKQLSSQKAQSISEVLIVVDEHVFYNIDRNDTFHKLMMKEFIREFNLCGTPIDIYMLSDLTDMNLDNYKFICFNNCNNIDCSEWENIKIKLNDNSTILWTYYLQQSKDISGFELIEHKKQRIEKLICNGSTTFDLTEFNFPFFEISDDMDVEKLACYSDKKTAMAQKYFGGHQHIFCSVPVLKSKQLRFILKYTGCKIYIDADCTVYGDSRFLALFAHSDIYQKPEFSNSLFDVESKSSLNTQNRLKMKATSYKFFCNATIKKSL